MKKQRIYTPVSDDVKKTISDIAVVTNRSEAYIAEQLINDGIKFNMLTHYQLDPSADIIYTFIGSHK